MKVQPLQETLRFRIKVCVLHMTKFVWREMTLNSQQYLRKQFLVILSIMLWKTIIYSRDKCAETRYQI